MQCLRCKVIMLQDDILMMHIIIIKLHVDIKKLHINIIMLHVDITHRARNGQTYATKLNNNKTR